jgi:hypothetical protein
MADYAVDRFECQYDTPPLDLQVQRSQSHNRRQQIGCEDKVWAAQVTFDSRADHHVGEAGIRPRDEGKKQVPQPLVTSLSLRNKRIWNHDIVFGSGVRREQRRAGEETDAEMDALESRPPGRRMASEGADWTPAHNDSGSRQNSWEPFRERLKNATKPEGRAYRRSTTAGSSFARCPPCRAMKWTWTTWTARPTTMYGRQGFALGTSEKPVPQPLRASLFLRNKGVWNQD